MILDAGYWKFAVFHLIWNQVVWGFYSDRIPQLETHNPQHQSLNSLAHAIPETQIKASYQSSLVRPGNQNHRRGSQPQPDALTDARRQAIQGEVEIQQESRLCPNREADMATFKQPFLNGA
jgi:hypothetical protein